MKIKMFSGKRLVALLIIILIAVVSGLWVQINKSKNTVESITETTETIEPIQVIAEPIKWYSYEEGMALGKRKGKKIFLYFWADWCTFCKKMEKETLTKSSIVSYLNDYFISVKVNSVREKKKASLYSVEGVPTTWFLTENGEKLANLPGYISPDIFLPALQFMHSESYQKMTFKKFQKELANSKNHGT
ncbi:thioredoxin [Desulfobacteraceae bacterium SEEP-SAG9]|nr:thioredoxin [Desulfobacteraceae bacterium SEEP-SAG9]